MYKNFGLISLVMATLVCFSYLNPSSSQNKPADIEESGKIMKMKYTRVYADSAGESHFEDITVEMKEMDFAPPAPPLNLSPFFSATNYGFMSASPGWYGDWHPTPKRQIMFYLQGEIEAEVSDGEIRRFGPGSVTLVEDTTGRGHKSRVVGTVDVLLAVVQLEE